MIAKELSLGNLVTYNGQVSTVTIISDNNTVGVIDSQGNINVVKIETLEAISITDSLLNKSGFDNDKGVFTYYLNDCVFTLRKSQNKNLWYCSVGIDLEIRYLHELQNIIRILFKTELEVKYEHSNFRK